MKDAVIGIASALFNMGQQGISAGEAVTKAIRVVVDHKARVGEPMTLTEQADLCVEVDTWAYEKGVYTFR